MKRLLVFVFLIYSLITNAQCSLSISPNTHSKKINTTGISRLDNLIEDERLRMEELFDVKVELNISEGANGLALKSCKSTNCHGTIELGVKLLKAKLDNTSGDFMVIAIMAHEFAHILQYKHSMRFNSNVHQEIHADILAGWYIGKYLKDIENKSISNLNKHFDKQEEGRKIIDDLRIYFGQMGDEAYFSPFHHGNFQTRLMAMHKGIRASHIKGLDWEYTFLRWGRDDAQSYIDKYNH
tara:strand:- start:242 stop:958 length:717 start_codon:yes stop_codon:yes gene_type:complete